MPQYAAVFGIGIDTVRDMNIRAQRTQLVDELDGGGALAPILELAVAGPGGVTPLLRRVGGESLRLFTSLQRGLPHMNMQSPAKLPGNTRQIHERLRL